MEKVILPIANALDSSRAFVLRTTLSISFLRNIFRNRASRLLFLFLIAATVNLTLSIFFPLWVLIIGPVLYGVPHLFSSLRYIHHTLLEANDSQSENLHSKIKLQSFRFFTFIFASISILRLIGDLNLVLYEFLTSSNNSLEIISFIITFVGISFLYRKSLLRIILGCAIAGPILAAAWLMPLWTSGVLILLHNLIAFIYWIAATKTKSERAVSVFATTLFVILTALIFVGFFDGLYKYFTPIAIVRWADVDYSAIGKMIAPWSDNYVLWSHAVVAYAFGQSLHYFVWLKAIPDEHHRSDTPTSFKQSYQLLVRDFGRKATYASILTIFIFIGVWIFINHPQARILYFAVAAYHGYFEIAGLSLTKLKPVS